MAKSYLGSPRSHPACLIDEFVGLVTQLLDFWCCGQLPFLSTALLKGMWCVWISSLILDLDSHLFKQTLHLWPPGIMSPLASHLLKVAKTLQDPSKATRLLRPLKLRLVLHNNHQTTNANLLCNLPSPSKSSPEPLKNFVMNPTLNSARTPEPFKLSETWEMFVIYIQNLQTYQISQYPRNPGSSCQRSGLFKATPEPFGQRPLKCTAGKGRIFHLPGPCVCSVSWPVVWTCIWPRVEYTTELVSFRCPLVPNPSAATCAGDPQCRWLIEWRACHFNWGLLKSQCSNMLKPIGSKSVEAIFC